MGHLAELGSIDTVNSPYPNLGTYFVHVGPWI